MYTLFTRDVPLASDDPADLVGALYKGGQYRTLNEEERFLVRIKLAQHFRSAAQAYAISRYPLETLTTLTPAEQDVLYEDQPHVLAWHHLPPLVLVNINGAREIEGSVIDGVSTISLIDVHSDAALLRSLSRCGVIRVDHSLAAS